MGAAIKAELRKLFTVRSTYVWLIFALVVSGAISFFVAKGVNSASPQIYMQAASLAGKTIAMPVAIIAILLMAHEYRYSTIMYTFTSTNNRAKTLLAKIAVMVLLGIGTTIAAMVVAIAATQLSATIFGHDLGPQQFFYISTLWRITVYVLCYILAALMITVIFRHIVGALVTFLLFPNTVEPLAGILLKDNAKYLPFTALDQVHTPTLMSPAKGLLIFAVYLVAGWIVAWILFMRRDAN